MCALTHKTWHVVSLWKSLHLTEGARTRCIRVVVSRFPSWSTWFTLLPKPDVDMASTHGRWIKYVVLSAGRNNHFSFHVSVMSLKLQEYNSYRPFMARKSLENQYSNAHSIVTNTGTSEIDVQGKFCFDPELWRNVRFRLPDVPKEETGILRFDIASAPALNPDITGKTLLKSLVRSIRARRGEFWSYPQHFEYPSDTSSIPQTLRVSLKHFESIPQTLRVSLKHFELPQTLQYPSNTSSITLISLNVTQNSNTNARTQVQSTGLEHFILERDLMGPGWIRVVAPQTERLLQLVLLGSCGGRSKSDSEVEGRATRTTASGHGEFEDRARCQDQHTWVVMAVLWHIKCSHGRCDRERERVGSLHGRKTCCAVVCLLIFVLWRGSKRWDGHLEITKNVRDLCWVSRARVHRVDPDIIVGHNIYGFDLDVLLQNEVQQGRAMVQTRTSTSLTHAQECGRKQQYYSLLGQLARGRLVCDTYLAAKNIRETSYRLRNLAVLDSAWKTEGYSTVMFKYFVKTDLGTCDALRERLLSYIEIDVQTGGDSTDSSNHGSGWKCLESYVAFESITLSVHFNHVTHFRLRWRSI